MYASWPLQAKTQDPSHQLCTVSVCWPLSASQISPMILLSRTPTPAPVWWSSPAQHPQSLHTACRQSAFLPFWSRPECGRSWRPVLPQMPGVSDACSECWLGLCTTRPWQLTVSPTSKCPSHLHGERTAARTEPHPVWICSPAWLPSGFPTCVKPTTVCNLPSFSGPVLLRTTTYFSCSLASLWADRHMPTLKQLYDKLKKLWFFLQEITLYSAHQVLKLYKPA